MSCGWLRQKNLKQQKLVLEGQTEMAKMDLKEDNEDNVYLFLKKSFSPRSVVTASRTRLGSQASGVTGCVGSGSTGLTGPSGFEPVEIILLC